MTETPNIVEETNDPEAVDPATQLNMLKQRADVMGIGYSPRIGLDSLQRKIDAKLAADEAPVAVEEGVLTPQQKRIKIRKGMRENQLKLVRLRITNLNPSKKDLSGEIFTIANKYLGTVRKYIPYGEVTENGYHVPYIIYQQMKDRKFLNVKTKTNSSNGQINVETRWVNEFALEVLPQLTEKELQNLANAQAMAAGDAG